MSDEGRARRTITITYESGGDVDIVNIHPDDELSSIEVLGILEVARDSILNPDDAPTLKED